MSGQVVAGSVCRNWRDTGTCAWGDGCWFKHESTAPAVSKSAQKRQARVEREVQARMASYMPFGNVAANMSAATWAAAPPAVYSAVQRLWAVQGPLTRSMGLLSGAINKVGTLRLNGPTFHLMYLLPLNVPTFT